MMTRNPKHTASIDGGERLSQSNWAYEIPEDLWWRATSVADVQRASLTGDVVPPVRVEAAFVPWACLHAANKINSRWSTP